MTFLICLHALIKDEVRQILSAPMHYQLASKSCNGKRLKSRNRCIALQVAGEEKWKWKTRWISPQGFRYKASLGRTPASNWPRIVKTFSFIPSTFSHTSAYTSVWIVTVLLQGGFTNCLMFDNSLVVILFKTILKRVIHKTFPLALCTTFFALPPTVKDGSMLHASNIFQLWV